MVVNLMEFRDKKDLHLNPLSLPVGLYVILRKLLNMFESVS